MSSLKDVVENVRPARTEEKPELFISPELSEYKGKQILSIPVNGHRFSFGLGKAKAIVLYFDRITKFVGSEGREF